jgi:hypothetical protein
MQGFAKPWAALASLAVAAGALSAALPATARPNVDVGVSIGISQPGVYGRVDIGRFPQPQVVVAQPVIVHRVPPPVVVHQPVVVHRPVQPVYMWVPPGHRKNWRQHCAQYGACGAPVYFVSDRWYHDRVHAGPGRPYWHEKGHGKGHGHGHGRGHGRGDRDHD